MGLESRRDVHDAYYERTQRELEGLVWSQPSVSVGGGIVSTEMTADRSPGTAIVETRIVVVPSRTGFMRVE